MIHRAARLVFPGFGLEDMGAALAASREREPPRGHAGGLAPSRDALDLPLGDGEPEARTGDRDRDLALDLIRLVRALVLAAIVSQLATLALVGGLSGANLAIQLGWVQIDSGPATSEE